MIIFWVISFVAVSFTASAHETGMAVSKEYGVQMQHMAHASSSKASCSDNGTCSDKAGLCDLVCTGVGVFLPLDPTSTYAISLEEKYLSRPEADLVATAPRRTIDLPYCASSETAAGPARRDPVDILTGRAVPR